MPNHQSLILITCVLGLGFLTGCGSESTSNTGTAEAPAVEVPSFDRDSAFSFVRTQVEFGPRVPGTPGHAACREWIASTCREMGLEVIEQHFTAKTYTGTEIKGVNIMGRFNPGATKRILLAAHWDTRHIADSPLSQEKKDEPIPGADDGGSGVAVLLEIARQLQQTPVDIGVDFLFFDAEDHGDDRSDEPNPESWCLGSQYWSSNLMPPGYRPKYGILLDMVGAKNTRFPKEGISMSFAPDLVNKVWKLGQSLGYGRFFVDQKVGTITDDHFFVNTLANIPMIDIIGMPQIPGSPTSFGEHWHTHHDNLDVIDVRTLRAVGQTVLEVIYREAAGQF